MSALRNGEGSCKNYLEVYSTQPVLSIGAEVAGMMTADNRLAQLGRLVQQITIVSPRRLKSSERQETPWVKLQR